MYMNITMHISGVAHGENPGLTENQTESSANFVLFGSLLSQPWPKLVWLWLSAAITMLAPWLCYVAINIAGTLISLSIIIW